MGRSLAVELADSLDISLDEALSIHLSSNHYPPIPLTMLEPCKAAIDFCKHGNSLGEIQLPSGITYKGKRFAPAWAIVEQHHLDAWLESEDDE